MIALRAGILMRYVFPAVRLPSVTTTFVEVVTVTVSTRGTGRALSARGLLAAVTSRGLCSTTVSVTGLIPLATGSGTKSALAPVAVRGFALPTKVPFTIVHEYVMFKFVRGAVTSAVYVYPSVTSSVAITVELRLIVMVGFTGFCTTVTVAVPGVLASARALTSTTVRSRFVVACPTVAIAVNVTVAAVVVVMVVSPFENFPFAMVQRYDMFARGAASTPRTITFAAALAGTPSVREAATLIDGCAGAGYAVRSAWLPAASSPMPLISRTCSGTARVPMVVAKSSTTSCTWLFAPGVTSVPALTVASVPGGESAAFAVVHRYVIAACAGIVAV